MPQKQSRDWQKSSATPTIWPPREGPTWPSAKPTSSAGSTLLNTRTERRWSPAGFAVTTSKPCERELAPHGGAVAELTPPRGVMPPTKHAEHASTAALRPLVSTYGTVPYRDLDPTWFAAIAYMAMFGMMFGDVGHGMALVILGVAAARLHDSPIGRLAPAAPFLLVQESLRSPSDSSTAKRSDRLVWSRRSGSARWTNPRPCCWPASSGEAFSWLSHSCWRR